MIMPLAARAYPQSLIHSDERHESHHDGNTEQQVPIRLHNYKFHSVMFIFSQEYLRQQVEQSVAEQPPNCERDHDGEGRGIDVGRT